MMKVTRNDWSVGVFLLVALGATAAFLIAKAGTQGWYGAKRFHIEADNGRNIKEQAPVRMAGIPIGTVERLAMAHDSNLIEVYFRIDPAFAPKIREDAVATIIEPPVLGLTYVEIKSPGSPGVAVAKSGTKLKFDPPKSLLDSIDTTVKRVESIIARTDDALAEANRTLASITKITKEVADGDGFVSKLVKDQQLAADLKKTVAHVALISEDMTGVTGGLRRREGALGHLLSSDELIVNTEKLLAKAKESLTSLDDVTKRLTSSVELVAGRLDQAGHSIEGVKQVLENTQKVTKELATLTSNLNQGRGTIGKFLADDAVFVEAKGLLKEIRETVQDLREQAPINSFIGVVFSAF